ncbi:hypothetical protein E4U55_002591 [Claviceps digitariae]|nr:hypothetical protein E4U55_002591 [Claviceps digitariae]
MLATDLLATRLPSGLANMLGLQGGAPIEARPRGRSRYSKALPSVPIVSDTKTETETNTDSSLPPLPPIPSAGSNPGFNPAATDNGKSLPTITSIVRKPVGSSTPKSSSRAGSITRSPLLLPTSCSAGSSAGSSTSSSTASTMIPRRPVAAALHPPVLRTLIAPPEPSPTDSICSLLSAYAREPDDSLSGSTYTTVSTSNRIPDSGNSSSTAADGALVRGSQRSQNTQTQSSAVTSSHGQIPSGPEDGSHPPPPPAPAPPPKDGDLDKLNSQLKPLPSAPESEQTASPNLNLWKRRSQTANKNKELPDLKLNLSYRSTTSLSSIRTAVSRTSSDTITNSKVGAAAPPRPLVKGLPGRNVRLKSQVKSSDHPPCSATHSMGSVVSKVNNLKHKWASSMKTSEKLNRVPKRSDTMRPPTPEYRKGDINPPSTPGVNHTKPASPVSATGSSPEGAKPTRTAHPSHTPSPQPFFPSALPSETEAKPAISYNKLASMNSIPKRKQLAAAPEPRVAASTSAAAEAGQKRSSPSHDMAAPATRRQPQLPRTPSERNRGPSNSPDSASKRFSASTPGPGPDGLAVAAASSSLSSRRPGMAASGGAPAPDPRIVYSDTQEPMYRGRDGTLYAEMKLLEAPDPKASYFPRQTDQSLTGAGTIIASKPLSQSHFNCFHQHKTMHRRSNRHYSLTCQTCDKADTEDRWVCTFCYLRICDSCLRALNGHHKVLRSLVDQLGMSNPLSLSSLSRSGSAPGVDVEMPA